MHTLDLLRSGALTGIRRLDLNGAGLAHLPPEVYGLADTLEVLNLSDNQLTSLPPDLPRLQRLKVIFCSGNPFTHLPEVLGDCPALEMVGFKACRLQHVPATALPPTLRWLTLTDNAIGQLPAELGQRPALQKLMLSGNRLSALPDSLAGAQRLELVRLSANRFTQLPGWLTELPALAWLAVSGNPLGWASDAGGPSCAPLPSVPWGTLTVDGLLGEGASGHIYRAHGVGKSGRASDGERDGEGIAWALKLFKGAVTSDGLPEHELAACLAAGQHPALCTPVAQLVDHPDGLSGLLLPLIPPDFVNLAGPPSLSSCTRDVYAPGLQMECVRAAARGAHRGQRGGASARSRRSAWRPVRTQHPVAAHLGPGVAERFWSGHAVACSPANLGARLAGVGGAGLWSLAQRVAGAVGSRAMPAPCGELHWRMACTAAVPAHRPDMAAVASTLQTLLPATL
jgi:hypothetical protein